MTLVGLYQFTPQSRFSKAIVARPLDLWHSTGAGGLAHLKASSASGAAGLSSVCLLQLER